jgi:hypothetical protein
MFAHALRRRGIRRAVGGAVLIASGLLTSPALASVTVTVSGSWYDKAGQYISGRPAGEDSFDGIDVCFSRTGEAVSAVGWDEIAADGSIVDRVNEPVGDQPSGCVMNTSAVVWSNLDEGGHTYRAWARGSVSDYVYSDPWTVYVDRTEPSTASGFSAVFDPGTGTALVRWNNAVDPPLADGSDPSGVYDYQYTLQRGSSSTSGNADEPYISIDNASVGEQIGVTIRAADAVGNEGATTTATVTVAAQPTDTGAPTLSLSGAQAIYSATENATLLRWSPADDADLSDGDPSAGVDQYSVTYSLDGGAPVTTTTEAPRLLLSGGHVGQGVVLTVAATDVAGNAGTQHTANLSSVAWTPQESGDTVACAPTADGVPPDCDDNDDETDDSPAALLTQDDGESVFGRAAESDNLPRLRIDVKRNWTTARLRPGSWAIGNVKSGWTLDRVGAQVKGYTFGTIRGNFDGCGWILSELLGDPYANDGTSNCVNQGEDGPPLHTIAIASNPGKSHGVKIKLRTDLDHSVRFCAYIVPNPETIRTRHTCGGTYKTVSAADLRDGYEVFWRYVIRGRGWVMVKDSHKNAPTATINWWFVPRSAFGVICDPNVFGNACPPQF